MPSPSSPGSPRPASNESTPQPDDSEAWLALVAEKIKSMRFGVLQITVHESRIVQIERTERTRFESPRPAGRRQTTPPSAD